MSEEKSNLKTIKSFILNNAICLSASYNINRYYN